MVGGSVSGKPFKADPTSYELTGIPCGAPARYRSRAVIRLNTQDAEPYEDQRLDAPGMGTQSEAEEHLRKMVQNQLNTHVSLERTKIGDFTYEWTEWRNQRRRNQNVVAKNVLQLAAIIFQYDNEGHLHGGKRKAFTKATTYKPFCPDKSSGALSLKDYRSLEELDQRVEKLREYGLTEDEIQFRLEQEGFVSEAPKRSRYGANPAVNYAKNDELESRIREKDRELSRPDIFSNVRVVSRHAMEVERSLHRGTDKAHCLSHLVQVGSTDESKDVLEWSKLEGKRNNEACSSTTSLHNETRRKMPDRSSTKKSDQSLELATHVSDESVVCSKEGELVRSGKVELPPDIQAVSDEEILKNKLSPEAIREIPRFKNYQPGLPNKTLYIKNLSPKVSEADLVSLFIKFQHKDGPRIVFRLMKGRMKGQAFVTLTDVSTASAALELVNGYQLRGKAIIIQYGRQIPESNPEDTVKTTGVLETDSVK